MVSRIMQIKGIGRFINMQTEHLELGTNTLVFGQNTAGKSTLTDIFWSLKTGDPALIEGRRTFGYSGPQQVELQGSNGFFYTYPGAAWNEGNSLIEIFDTQFINENIFEGNEIHFDNQQKLHNIIIGGEGKRLSDDLMKCHERFAQITKEKTDRTKYFNRAFEKKILMPDFQHLPKFDDPERLIKELQSTIEVASNQEKIRETFESVLKLLDNIVQQPTKAILQRTLETNADAVVSHIQQNWKNPEHSVHFLQTGLELTKGDEKSCVFCGQQLNASAIALLKTYSQVFSEEYKKFQLQVAATVDRFEKFNPVQIIENLKDKLQVVAVNLDLSAIDTNRLTKIKRSAEAEFRVKKDDLSSVADFTAFDELISIFQTIEAQVHSLAKKFIFSTEADLASLRNKIFEVEMSKIRHTEIWDDFFKKEAELDAEQAAVKQQREMLRERLAGYSEALYQTHFNSINKLLSEMGADFRISEFKPLKKLVGKSERLFEIEFYDQYRILISEIAPNQPKFKNSLSESDKRLLAFAFFFSLLLHDEKLEEKIVLFDDPFSSFDMHRRAKIVELLANPYLISEEGERIEKKFGQLIVLTHEAEFFQLLSETLQSPTRLEIVDDGFENKVRKSTLKEYEPQV
ncbi:MAG: AAA family ATPase [Chitinophagaceae bacterium]